MLQMEVRELLYNYTAGKRNFSRLNFRDRWLSWTDLRQIDLSYADLSLSVLEGVDLTEANLRGVNLARADLTLANLYKADLRDADLRGADLRGAELSYVNFLNADLRCVSLQGADLSNAVMPNGFILPNHFIVQRGAKVPADMFSRL